MSIVRSSTTKESIDNGAILSPTRTGTVVAESTSMTRLSGANPRASTRRVYSPGSTSSKRKVPAAVVSVAP